MKYGPSAVIYSIEGPCILTVILASAPFIQLFPPQPAGGKSGSGMTDHGTAASDSPLAFTGFRLQVDPVPPFRRKGLLHGPHHVLQAGGKTGLLGYHHTVRPFEAPACRRGSPGYILQEHKARNPFVFHIRCGIQGSYIPEPRSAEDGVAESVDHGVAV